MATFALPLVSRPLELLNVNRVTAEIERYRHGERHKPDVLAGEEQDDEIRMGIGHQGNVITAFQIEAEQAPGRDPGLLLQFTVWQNDAELALRVVKIAPGNTCRRVVQRLRQTGELG